MELEVVVAVVSGHPHMFGQSSATIVRESMSLGKIRSKHSSGVKARQTTGLSVMLRQGVVVVVVVVLDDPLDVAELVAVVLGVLVGVLVGVVMVVVVVPGHTGVARGCRSQPPVRKSTQQSLFSLQVAKQLHCDRTSPGQTTSRMLDSTVSQ